MAELLITGDLVISDNTYQIDKIDKNLIDMFQKSDYNIINLECPVTDSNNKIVKTGPHLKGNATIIAKVLDALNIDMVTLANNHIMDYSEKGLKDTLSFCKKNNLQYVGAGTKLSEASLTKFIQVGKFRIALVNIAENEWASATLTSAGANPVDIINNAKQLQEAKLQADKVIVIVHGGHEYYNLPSPRMQKLYRFFVDSGADLVVGHHTHCVSGYELYNEVPIYYSLGNFLFTKHSVHDDWYKGVFLKVEFDEMGGVKSNLHPVKQKKDTFEIELMPDKEKSVLLGRIASFNKIIKDKNKLDLHWENYIEQNYTTYLNHWSPLSFINNPYVKGAFNRLGIQAINKKGIALALNLMRCEAHSDLSREILSKYLRK